MAGQRIELPAYSMFTATPVYEVGTDISFGLRVPAVVKHSSDVAISVPPAGEHRLDRISAEFYGVPDLWAVIADVNCIADPLVAVPTGTKLRIPAKDRLASEGVLNV